MDMTKQNRAELREVKQRIKRAATDLAAARRINGKTLKLLTRQRRAANKSFDRSEATIHKDNRLAEREHSKSTRSLLKRQAVLEGRLAS